MAALRYAGTHLPPDVFVPAALKVAATTSPPQPLPATSPKKLPVVEVDPYVSIHRLIVGAGHPDLSPKAALSVAGSLTSATSSNPYQEQQWRDKAKEFYQLAVDSGHPVYARQAAGGLARDSFKVARSRFEEWDREEERRKQANRDMARAFGGTFY
jgi:hypothetical protein